MISEDHIRLSQHNVPECWQALTLWPRTQASQANFSPLMSIIVGAEHSQWSAC